jgi:hypothetical protein
MRRELVKYIPVVAERLGDDAGSVRINAIKTMIAVLDICELFQRTFHI